MKVFCEFFFSGFFSPGFSLLLFLPCLFSLSFLSLSLSLSLSSLSLSLFPLPLLFSLTSKCSSPIPEITVWPESGSVDTLNVGSSLWNRASAFEKLPEPSRVVGETASDMTGSGTFIDVSDSLRGAAAPPPPPPPPTKVSPDEQSTPKTATMSPADADAASTISSECIRTSRGTLTRLPVATLSTESPLASLPL